MIQSLCNQLLLAKNMNLRDPSSRGAVFQRNFCRFFCRSDNAVVAYHRSSLASAAVPLLYDVALLTTSALTAELSGTYQRAATFSGLIAFCFALHITGQLLVPREKVRKYVHRYINNKIHPLQTANNMRKKLRILRHTVMPREGVLKLLTIVGF